MVAFLLTSFFSFMAAAFSLSFLILMCNFSVSEFYDERELRLQSCPSAQDLSIRIPHANELQLGPVAGPWLSLCGWIRGGEAGLLGP